MEPTIWPSRYAKKTGKPMCGRLVGGAYICRGSMNAAVGTRLRCRECGCLNIVMPKPRDVVESEAIG